MRKIQSNKKIDKNIKRYTELKRELYDVNLESFLQNSAFMAGIMFHIDHPEQATDLAFAFDELEDYHLHVELARILIEERILYGVEGDLSDVVDKFMEDNNIEIDGDKDDDF